MAGATGMVEEDLPLAAESTRGREAFMGGIGRLRQTQKDAKKLQLLRRNL